MRVYCCLTWAIKGRYSSLQYFWPVLIQLQSIIFTGFHQPIDPTSQYLISTGRSRRESDALGFLFKINQIKLKFYPLYYILTDYNCPYLWGTKWCSDKCIQFLSQLISISITSTIYRLPNHCTFWPASPQFPLHSPASNNHHSALHFHVFTSHLHFGYITFFWKTRAGIKCLRRTTEPLFF